MEETPSFGQWVRRWRKALAMTQEQLAEKAYLSTVYISLIERGERYPAPDAARSLAKALGLAGDTRIRFMRWCATRRLPSDEQMPLPAPPEQNAPVRPSARLSSKLSTPPNPLVGREAEVSEAIRILTTPRQRLLTVSG